MNCLKHGKPLIPRGLNLYCPYCEKDNDGSIDSVVTIKGREFQQMQAVIDAAREFLGEFLHLSGPEYAKLKASVRALDSREGV